MVTSEANGQLVDTIVLYKLHCMVVFAWNIALRDCQQLAYDVTVAFCNGALAMVYFLYWLQQMCLLFR